MPVRSGYVSTYWMNEWSGRGEEALGLVLHALNLEIFLSALASFLFGPLPYTSGTRSKLRQELGLGLIRQIGIKNNRMH